MLKNKRSSFSLRFGICQFGIWDLLQNFRLECAPNVHTKFANAKEADGQISVVLCGRPEFLRQNQKVKRPQRNGDHGLGEKGLHVHKSRSCCEQWFSKEEIENHPSDPVARQKLCLAMK